MSWRNKKEPDYYGSLERLPIAPLKGKPPPYASRRQQDARRGNQHLLKGYGGLSSSVGDLYSPSNRNKTNSVTSNGGNLKEWDKGDRGAGVPLNPRQRHGSTGGVSNAPTATPEPHLHHQRQGSVSYSYSEVTSEPERRTHGQTHNRREQGIAQKVTQQHRQGDRNTDRNKGASQERLGATGGETSRPEPTETLDRKQKKGSYISTLKNYRELAAIPDHTLVKWSRSKSMNDLGASEDNDINGTRDDGEYNRDGETRSARSGFLRSKSEDEVNCGREERLAAQEAWHSTISSTSSSSSSPSLPSSPVHSPTQNNQAGSRGDDDGGVFVATPVFLESSPSSSPSSSPPPSSSVQQQQDFVTDKQDLVDSERDSALSTLRREILHLTQLKEEIEQNLIRSQMVLKEEVVGLREERGGLETAVEQREKQLHAQEAEIQDLKDTIAQLQTLVFASDGEVRLQRQASDLQEQLREEKRYRLEETTRLRHEVRALTSRLQDKENQLEKYKSDSSLSSWGYRGLGNDITEDWKTSLPDVRKGEVLPSLGASVAERRKSFSGMSDSLDDGHSSAVVSTHSWKYKTKEDMPGRLNGASVQSYKAVESSRNSSIAPVNDSRSNASSIKSNGGLVKASPAVVIPGKYDMTPTNEPWSAGASVRSYKAMELSGKSRTAAVDDSVLQAAPMRSYMPVESSGKSYMKSSDKSRLNGVSVRSDNSLLTSGKSNVATLNISRSDMPPFGDALESGTEKVKKDHISEERGKTRVKTTFYVEIGDYKRSGGCERHEGGDYKRSGSYEGNQGGDYKRSGSYEGHQGGDCEAPRRTSIPPVTKSSVPSVSHQVSSSRTVPSSPPIPRPSVPPPPPPQVTRVAGTHVTSPHDPPSLPEVSRSTSVPPQATRTSQVTKLGSAPPTPEFTVSLRIHPAQERSCGLPQVPGDVETSARTSWMYKPVSESGGTPVEGEGKKRDPEVPRGEARMSGVRVGEAGRSVGGTSYISVTIQCLFTLPPLRHFFLEKFWHLGVRSEVAVAVAGAFQAMKNGTGEHRAMQCLREAVQRRDKVFLLHQDPPAADLLSCLLAWLHNDLVPQAHPKGPPAPSVVSQLFHGLRESLIVCSTREKILSYAPEAFNFLTLSVPGEGAWTLQELLARRFHPQEMMWECQPCGQRHTCSHQTCLLRPPQVLVLYLRRPLSAVAARVLFPEAGLVLQVQQQHQHWQNRETRTLRSPEYQLLGVVSREDLESGGSYYAAFCRRLEGGRWGMWKEQHVTAVSRREVLSQQGVHLLFYLQQQERQ